MGILGVDVNSSGVKIDVFQREATLLTSGRRFATY
jgi:hypothetical protein